MLRWLCRYCFWLNFGRDKFEYRICLLTKESLFLCGGFNFVCMCLCVCVCVGMRASAMRGTEVCLHAGGETFSTY